MTDDVWCGEEAMGVGGGGGGGGVTHGKSLEYADPRLCGATLQVPILAGSQDSYSSACGWACCVLWWVRSIEEDLIKAERLPCTQGTAPEVWPGDITQLDTMPHAYCTAQASFRTASSGRTLTTLVVLQPVLLYMSMLQLYAC